MAQIYGINIHNPKKVSVNEVHDTYENKLPFSYVRLILDDFVVTIFDITKEDLRAALYRADMEVYDADSA